MNEEDISHWDALKKIKRGWAESTKYRPNKIVMLFLAEQDPDTISHCVAAVATGAAYDERMQWVHVKVAMPWAGVFIWRRKPVDWEGGGRVVELSDHSGEGGE